MNKKLRDILAFVAVTLAVILCIPGVGQVLKGSISGTVTDPQGAVVSGAQVKATNIETGAVYTTTSDSSGLFRINLIPTGTYNISVASQGFKTAESKGVVVAAGSDSGLGTLHLAVGEASTTLEVVGTAPLIDTTQAQVTNTFTGVTLTTFSGIQENEGLDNLALFVPGVNPTRSNSFSNSNGGGGFTVDGIRGRNNDQEIDGQNNNDNSVGGPGLFISSPEFVQQYVLITNNFGPEYGRNSGSVVNIITKSGTNSWHGALFGNETNSFFNALSNTQRRFTQIPPDFHFLTGPPRSNEEYSGGTIGGPIAKNKVFIFGGFDNDLFSGSNIFVTNSQTPTPAGLATLAGCYTNNAPLTALSKFGPFGISGGNPVPIPNPTTKAFTVRTITPGGSLPTCAGVQFGGVERVLPIPFHGFDWVAKTDLQLGSDTITGRYLFNRGNTFNRTDSGTAGAAAGYTDNVPALSQVALLSWTHNFTPHMVNEARVSFGRLNVEFGGNTIGNTVATAGNLDQAVSRIDFNSSATFQFFGPATNLPQQRIVNTWQGQDNWNYVLGKHSLKAGVNWTYQRSPNIFLPTINGRFRFTNYNTFIANTPNLVQVANGPSELDFREYDTFVYGGDDWKIGQNLTLNLGLTWTYYGQPANLFNQITTSRESGSGGFWNPALPSAVRTFPEVSSPKNSFGPSVGFAYVPHWGWLTGDGKTTLRGGYRLLYDPPFYNIYLNISTSSPEVFLQAFSGAQAAAIPLPATPTGPVVRAQLAPQLQKGVFDPRSFAETVIPPDFGPDKVHTWSFGVERELTKNSALEARYIGNRGTNLFQTIDGNPQIGSYHTSPTNTVPGLLQTFPQFVPPGFTACPQGHIVPGPGQTLGGANPQLGQAFGAGRASCDLGIVRSRNNTGYSDYHGGQVEFRTNSLFKQLTLRTGYTFSKTTDNVSEIFSTGSAGNTSAFAQNPLDFKKGEHGTSGLDFTHSWAITATEEIPLFKSQKGAIGHLLGGWGFNATYRLGSGQPYTPIQAFEATVTDGNVDYYDAGFVNAFSGEVARPFLGNPNAPVSSVGVFCGDAIALFGVTSGQCTTAGGLNQLISVNALNTSPTSGPLNIVAVTKNDVRFIENTGIAVQVFGTPFGNVGRNVVRDAITNIGNFSVFKRTKITERATFEFHATALNVFNHFNFTSVDPFIVDAGLSTNGTGFADPSLTTAGGRRFFVGGRIDF